MRLLMMTQAIDLDHPVLGFTHHWVETLAQHVDHITVLCRLAGRHQLPSNVTLLAYAQSSDADIPLQRHTFFHRHLWRLVAGHQVDSVFVHMIPKWVIMAWPYCKMAGRPLTLWYTHGSVNGRLRIAHRLADQILTASAASYGLPGEHVRVMGHGIDTDRFVPQERLGDDGRFQILMPGRLSPTKKPHQLIAAIANLPKEQQQKLCCHLIGQAANPEDDHYVATLNAQIKANKLEERVKLLGAIPFNQMVHHYQQADLVINLSHTNSLDKTILEAMACGVPVLTSNPAFESILQPIDPNCLLPHDAPQQLGQRLHHWLKAVPMERQQLGERLRHEVVQHHNLSQLIARMATLLHDAA